MTENTSPKKIAANLDESTREDVPEPLHIVIGGKSVEFVDPMEFDYRVLDKVSDPDTFARYCVAEGDREHFKKQRLPVWKFRELNTIYMEHFKVDELLGN